MKVLRFLDEHLEEILLASFLVIITCSTGIQVVMRYLFNNSLSWTEEISRYALVASGFISIGYCIRNKVALRIDLFINFLPRKLRIIFSILCSLFLVWLFWRFFMGSLPVRAKMQITNATTPALDIPLLYIYTFPLIGFGLGVLRLVQSLIGDVLSLFRNQDESDTNIEIKEED